jgi:hypothetical protein
MDLQRFMLVQEQLKDGNRRFDELFANARSDREKMLTMYQAMEGLRRCWRDHDPGKYGHHWFLVKDYALAAGECWGLKKLDRVEKFWALELVDDAAEAKRCRRTQLYGPADERRPIPTGTLADAKMEPCPHCGTKVAVVGKYHQTEDSPDGDLWQLDLFTLCLTCMSCDNFARQVEELRFF